MASITSKFPFGVEMIFINKSSECRLCCGRRLTLIWLRDASSIYMIHGGSTDMSSEMRHGTAYRTSLLL